MILPISNEELKIEASGFHYISMDKQVYSDLCYYVDHYDTEVSGCGMVERIEHRTKAVDKDDPDIVEIEFRIKEVYLPEEQDNTSASTDIDDDIINKLLTNLLQLGKNTEHLRLHWHSHANMDTFHSGTDEDNYATLSNGEFLVSLVLNKAHSFLGRIDYFSPIRITMSGIGVYINTNETYTPSKEAISNAKKLDEYVKDKKVITYDYKPTYSYYDDIAGKGYEGIGKTIKEYKSYKSYKELDEKESQVARELKVPMEKALQYKRCSKLNCSTCNDTAECTEFLYYTDNFDL